MERTLLDDIIQVWNSLSCETENINFYHYCGYCKNEKICFMIENLIDSIKKFY